MLILRYLFITMVYFNSLLVISIAYHYFYNGSPHGIHMVALAP